VTDIEEATMKRTDRHHMVRIPAAIALLVTALFVPAAARAAEDAGAPGGFLRFGSSARSLGMGNAITGMADDAAAAYWNPAALAQLRTMELTGMGATLFEDTRYTFFSLGLPTQKAGSFSLSGVFFESGEFERTSLFEDTNETFSETAGMFALGYARGSGRFSWGLTLKSVQQSIAGASGSGVGLDVGLYYRPHRTISVGFSVQNAVAPELQLDREAETLARSGRVGAALRFFQNRLVVVSDVVKTELMDVDFRSGLEVWPLRNFAMRGGYDTVAEQATAGAAFRWENWQFDYSYLMHDLGGTNVFSATLRFGVPYGVKVHRDRTLFSPSGSERNVSFDIDTAVRGEVESWEVVISDQKGNDVRTLAGHGPPPEDVTWSGDDENGRLVEDGTYHVRVVILDDLGQEWDYDTSVQVLGFQDRTRSPIKVEISGDGSDDEQDQVKGKNR
jgi:hypothetical protein